MAISVLICGTTMAQVASSAQLEQTFCMGKTVKAVKHAQHLTRDGEEAPLWSCDFENGDSVIVEGNDIATGKDHWKVVTLATFPSTLATASGAYFKPFVYKGDTLCDTPEHWAMVDLISDYNGAPFGGTGQVEEGAWMEFNMNLSTSVMPPKICFKQLYRPLNAVNAYINVSVDGGATWTEHEVNAEVASNDYAPLNKEVIIPEAAGQAEVKIRFKMCGDGSGLQGYGWQIDDIKIVEVPAYNLTIQDSRISMFGYIDYRNIPDDYWTDLTDPAERRAYAYQLNDPMSQTPRQQWTTGAGIMGFNVEVINNGLETVTPKARVKITSPSGNEIFNKEVAATHTAAMLATDTLDFGELDEENEYANPTVFSFLFMENIEDEEDIELGRYEVEFYVFSEGHEDGDTTDNTEKQYFYITDNNFSASYDEPTSSFTFRGYQTSASGDEYGTEFTYYYIPDSKMSVDVYINGRTTIGTAVQANIYEYNTDEQKWVNRRRSDNVVITESMLNTWTSITFEDEYYVRFAEDKQYHQALVVIKGIWDDNDDEQEVYLGASDVLTSYGHNNLGCMRSGSNPDSWYYGFDQLAIRFHAGECEDCGDDVATFTMNEISMYPNPTTGIVNFENVENATIEVYNMMGQIIANTNSANSNASIDLSNAANGNYIVRIVKDGAVSTSKLNIVR